MARQPENLVLRILKKIQEIQAEHSAQLKEIKERLDDVDDGIVTALGLATQANIRQGVLDGQLGELRARVERLEKRRR
jgi:hypothetical protein